jgi:hypothetical protein
MFPIGSIPALEKVGAIYDPLQNLLAREPKPLPGTPTWAVLDFSPNTGCRRRGGTFIYVDPPLLHPLLADRPTFTSYTKERNSAKG